jgi:hypothetical protein
MDVQACTQLCSGSSYNQINDGRNQAQTQVGRPKDHGGRVFNLKIFNIGLMAMWIWKLFTKKLDLLFGSY